jgi:hypothetical protein
VADNYFKAFIEAANAFIRAGLDELEDEQRAAVIAAFTGAGDLEVVVTVHLSARRPPAALLDLVADGEATRVFEAHGAKAPPLDG